MSSRVAIPYRLQQRLPYRLSMRPGSAKLHRATGHPPRSRPNSAAGPPLLPSLSHGARGRPLSAGHQSLRASDRPSSPASLEWAAALRGSDPVPLSRPRSASGTASRRRRPRTADGQSPARRWAGELIDADHATRPKSAAGVNTDVLPIPEAISEQQREAEDWQRKAEESRALGAAPCRLAVWCAWWISHRGVAA
jgi:hypothetical protein